MPQILSYILTCSFISRIFAPRRSSWMWVTLPGPANWKSNLCHAWSGNWHWPPCLARDELVSPIYWFTSAQTTQNIPKRLYGNARVNQKRLIVSGQLVQRQATMPESLSSCAGVCRMPEMKACSRHNSMGRKRSVSGCGRKTKMEPPARRPLCGQSTGEWRIVDWGPAECSCHWGRNGRHS